MALSESMQSGPNTVYCGKALRPLVTDDEDRVVTATAAALLLLPCLSATENII